MNKILALLATIVCTNAVASHHEKVTLCLDVRSNYTNSEFNAHFESSDFFDLGSSVQSAIGQKCVSHTYKSGPKNIYLSLIAGIASDTLKITTSNCRSLYARNPSQPNNLRTDHLRSDKSEVLYTFHVSQILTDPTVRNRFNVDCEF